MRWPWDEPRRADPELLGVIGKFNYSFEESGNARVKAEEDNAQALLTIADALRKPPPEPTPTEPFVRCECGGHVFSRVIPLLGVRVVAGVPREQIIGGRYSCQRCPRVFSIDEEGRFEHHARSLPYSPQIPEAAQNDTRGETPKPKPIREPGPVPRARPSP